MTDFLAELDAEISEVIAKEKKASDLEKARKAANNPRLPSNLRAEAKEQYKALQLEVDELLWHPEASIALFAEQSCDGCGSIHRNFLQYMERQVHRKKSTTARWVRVSKPHPDLPRETMIQPLRTHICSDCSEDHGFGFEPDSCQYLETSTSITMSQTYHQEDINAPA